MPRVARDGSDLLPGTRLIALNGRRAAVPQPSGFRQTGDAIGFGEPI